MVSYSCVTCTLKQKQAFIWLTNMQFGAGPSATAHVSPHRVHCVSSTGEPASKMAHPQLAS